MSYKMTPRCWLSQVCHRVVHFKCHQTSNISHTLVGNIIVDHSDASLVVIAPTTSSFSNQHLASIDWAKTNNIKMRWETFEFWDLVWLILEVRRYLEHINWMALNFGILWLSSSATLHVWFYSVSLLWWVFSEVCYIFHNILSRHDVLWGTPFPGRCLFMQQYDCWNYINIICVIHVKDIGYHTMCQIICFISTVNL